MAGRLRFEVKTQLKGDAEKLQQSVRDLIESLPDQLYSDYVEVTLGIGQNVVPHKFNYVPKGYFLIYQDAASDIYQYSLPDANNLYLNSSAVTTIRIVVV